MNKNEEIKKFLEDLDGYDITVPSVVKCLKEHLGEYLPVYGPDKEDRKKFLVDREVDNIIRLYRVSHFQEMLLDLALEERWKAKEDKSE